MNTEQKLEEIQKTIQDLLKRMEDLDQWKRSKENQQLNYPLDFVSQQIIIGIQPGFSGTGSYTTFTIKNGIVTAAS